MYCIGEVYLVMMPHPDSLKDTSAEENKLWMFGEGEWLGLNR